MADKMTLPRYFVSDKVEHGCCAEATVRDREDLSGFGGYNKYPSIVCECGDTVTAERIARLLNETIEERPVNRPLGEAAMPSEGNMAAIAQALREKMDHLEGPTKDSHLAWSELTEQARQYYLSCVEAVLQQLYSLTQT